MYKTASRNLQKRGGFIYLVPTSNEKRRRKAAPRVTRRWKAVEQRRQEHHELLEQQRRQYLEVIAEINPRFWYAAEMLKAKKIETATR